MQENQLLELKTFIKKHAFTIYQYINQEVLNDVGVLHPNYFSKIIQEVFIDNSEAINDTHTKDLIPYFIFTLFSQKGTIAYTSLRAETINFSKLDNEASTYYNYARFKIENNILLIELMQAKIGGMPIDADIVKYQKAIPIKSTGLEDFIKDKKESENLQEAVIIEDSINKIL